MAKFLNYDKLIKQLERHEGVRLFPYRDTLGNLTIGCGRNLSSKGVSKEESDEMLLNDIVDTEKQLDVWLPWWRDKSENANLVLMDMCFNMGIETLLKFKRFLTALKKDDIKTAKEEMMDSIWAKQVGQRAKNLRDML